MSSRAIIDELEKVIAHRRDHSSSGASYVASLMMGGAPKIGAKIREEAAEVVVASVQPGDQGREFLVKEAADLMFHLLVLLGFRYVAWSEVEAELARRFGISGIAEKESRGRPAE